MNAEQQAKHDEVMEDIQCFASTWSVAGGRFDAGNAMQDAEALKTKISAAIAQLCAKADISELEKQNHVQKIQIELTAAEYERVKKENLHLSNRIAWAESQAKPDSVDKEIISILRWTEDSLRKKIKRLEDEEDSNYQAGIDAGREGAISGVHELQANENIDFPSIDGDKPICRFMHYFDAGDSSVGEPSREFWVLAENQENTLLADLLAKQAKPDSAEQVPVAWAIVVGDNLRNNFGFFVDREKAEIEYERAIEGGYDSIYRIHDLYAAPLNIAQQAPNQDHDEAVTLLSAIFDAWENGDPCNEEDGNYIGTAFRLDDDIFQRSCDLLNRINPPRNASLQSQLSQAQEENARLKKALIKISRPADYACGCSFPCRCDCPEAEVINAQAHRDIAIEALEGRIAMTNPNNEAMLLPCPFCGDAGSPTADSYHNHWVICEKCGVSTSEVGAENREAAIAKWNRRAAPAIPQADELSDEMPTHIIFDKVSVGKLDNKPKKITIAISRNHDGEPLLVLSNGQTFLAKDIINETAIKN